MSTAGMRSGRGARLPGMGTPATSPLLPTTSEPSTAADRTPQDERGPTKVAPAPAPMERRGSRAPNRSSARRGPAGDDREQTNRPRTEAVPAYFPHARDAKIQVNPRIYRGIWSHYEQLVDELPRERRRGALTALVNAVLAQHAPRNVAGARDAIAWLRKAEARDAPVDIGGQTT